MTDKPKIENKKVNKKPTLVKNSKSESKSESFIRIAEPRVKSVLRTIRILGNCSNRTNYEYSSEQVENMYSSIQIALDSMFSKFTPSKAEQETFTF